MGDGRDGFLLSADDLADAGDWIGAQVTSSRAPDWVEPFYTLQTQHLGLGGIEPIDRSHAAALEVLVRPGLLRILQLGAGHGGFAAAAADLGHSVVAVELAANRARMAAELATVQRAGPITVIEDDFYTVHIDDVFDAVVYWDGFGIGEDADQHRTLQRIKNEWLTPRGVALIEVFDAAFWIRQAPQEIRDDERELMQRLDYDDMGNRFIDSFWPIDRPEQRVSQSIRCYSPADLRLLVEGTGLTIASLHDTEGEHELGQMNSSGEPADSQPGRRRSFIAKLTL
jgi:hypothetical protein